MELGFDCEKVLDAVGTWVGDNIIVLDSNKLAKLSHPMYASSLSFKQNNMATILDRMGDASSRVRYITCLYTYHRHKA